MADQDLVIAEGNLDALENELEATENKYNDLLKKYNSGDNGLKEAVETSKAEIETLSEALAELEAEVARLKESDGEDMDMGDAKEKTGIESVRVDLGIARDNLTQLQEALGEAKTTSDKFASEYNNGERPDMKAQFDQATANFQSLLGEELGLKKEVNKLVDQLKKLKGKGSATDGQNEGPPGPQNPPGISVTGTGGDPIITIESDPEDLMSPEIARADAGLGPDDIRMEGWRGATRRLIVVGRGPKNASSYRMERESSLSVAFTCDEESDITLKANRYGEMKGRDKKYIYGKPNKPVIQGVAWLVKEPTLIPLDLLEPVKKGTKMARIEMAIKVKWTIDGVVVKSWETRSTIRRLWGHEIGDKYIYEAAKKQEKRYEEWLSKERPAEDRSPTPGDVPAVLEDIGGLQPGPALPASGLAPPLAAAVTGALPLRPQVKVKQEGTISPAKQYKLDWCDFNEVDPNNMTEEEQNLVLRLYRMPVPAAA